VKIPYARRTCAECPWKRDTPLGKFPPERYQALAGTACDMAMRVFACHMTKDGREHACAGFLIQQGGHNMSVRLALIDDHLKLDEIQSDGPLYENYREMAIANGVDPDDPCLEDVRDDGQTR
jgi:hypothetical protein